MLLQADPRGSKQALLAAVDAAYRQVEAAKSGLERARQAVSLAHRWDALAPNVRAAALQAHGSLAAWEDAQRASDAASEASVAREAAQREERYGADLELALRLSMQPPCAGC